MQDMLYWIWLSLACTPGSQSFSKLISKYSTPKAIYDEDREGISRALGTTKSADLDSLADKDLSRAEQIYEFCTSKGVGLLTYSDERYPENLRKLSNPPPLLYYRGTFPDFSNRTAVAVVGTRSLTDYGRRNAFLITSGLASAGALVVSGMAIGIDGVAHAAALSVSGETLAVLGSGIDVCYPKDHLQLAREIVKNGCIITEYPPKTPPNGPNFPVRNRIISGLCDGVLVVEGKERSGALITARYAKESGRRVYAVPGNVDNKNSESTNVLIKNGAIAVTRAEDIVSDLEELLPGRLDPFCIGNVSKADISEYLKRYSVSCLAPGDPVFDTKPKRKQSKHITQPSAVKPEQAETGLADPSGITKEDLAVYKKIPPEGGCAIESLIEGDLTLRKVMRILLKLEIGHFVTMLPGDRVRRNLH